ncbi:MAG TPA: D-alanyl-D-alanine carboxypeptidase/D-alanyl-D-alanine-endopeptidase [bacterium]|nr:D-alanyl-D-alanine carboxypeptidase/D-alanyl-D-alanine-endopeptidase [bacterium]
MFPQIRILLTLLLFILLSGCAATYQPRTSIQQPEKELARQIFQQINIPELKTAVVGIMVQSAETGEILFSHNANTLMMPASNEKILTSAAALLNLGPDFRYETKIFTNGSIDSGILKGDLIIIGSGDPSISYRLCKKENPCLVFSPWADSLRGLGIEKIEGDIIGIDDIFDDQPIGYGWTVDNLPYSYAAEVGGLMYHENFTTITIEADSAGDSINIAISPEFEFLDIVSKVSIDSELTKLDFDRPPFSNKIIISGNISPGDKIRQRMSVHNPTLFFVSALKRELINSGIEVSGDVLDGDDIDDAERLKPGTELFSHFSIPLEEILKILMKESQNLYAESLIKLLGHHFGEGGSFASGEKVLKRTLLRLGLEENYYGFKDGSGLSRYNYVSPAYLVKIFRRMHFHPLGDIYRDCLPIAGVDGTIGYRLKGTVAEGKIFAKTGTISNVRCLSGYAETADCETLIFSTMFNNFLCSVQVVLDVQDQICMLLSSFSRN